MIATLLLLSAATDPSVLIDRASRRLSARPWSLPTDDAVPRVAAESSPARVSLKDAALREDGRRCSLVGGRVCTNPPRTLVSAGF